jgi:HK97 family phage major capsid protein
MSYLDKVVERRDAVKAEMDAVLEAVASEDRTDLTTEETAKVDALVTESRTLDEKIEKLTAQATADAKAAEARLAVAEIATPKVGGFKATKESRTYSPDSDTSFFKDAYNAQFKSDYAAQERLARHQREEEIERRDVGTGSTSRDLVIPQYLMTTGSSTAVQATQNSAVSETDVDDTLLTIDVRTIAGQQDISRQAIERGTGIDQFVAQDLIRSWHTTLDNQIINGNGESGTIEGLKNAGGNAVTFTEAAPTAALLYPKLADAIQLIQTNSFVNPTHFLMHPRRLAFLLAAVDGSSRPLVVPAANGPTNAMATGAGSVAYGNSGYQMMGLPIITDANIGTGYGAGDNQDEIYVVTAPENHLWEQPGSPFTLRYDATGAGNLTIKTVVYGYAAFTAGRYPTANSIIAGTGLVAPTF